MSSPPSPFLPGRDAASLASSMNPKQCFAWDHTSVTMEHFEWVHAGSPRTPELPRSRGALGRQKKIDDPLDWTFTVCLGFCIRPSAGPT